MNDRLRRSHRHDSVLLSTVACGGSSLSLSRIFTFQPCACAQEGNGSSYGMSVYVLFMFVKQTGHFYPSSEAVAPWGTCSLTAASAVGGAQPDASRLRRVRLLPKVCTSAMTCEVTSR